MFGSGKYFCPGKNNGFMEQNKPLVEASNDMHERVVPYATDPPDERLDDNPLPMIRNFD